MMDEGFDVEGPLRYPDGPMVFEPGRDPSHRLSIIAHNVSEAEDDRWSEVNGRCQAQWSHAVEQIYLRQSEPTEDELRAWYQRAWDCMAEEGAPLSDPPTEAEAADAVAYGCEPWKTNG